jgi:hypothetical protein
VERGVQNIVPKTKRPFAKLAVITDVEAMASPSDSIPEENDEAGNTDGDVPRNPREIRLAKVSVTRTEHGVAMDIMAGKLRLRLFIESQWNDLIQKISAGQGELSQLVPFQMVPFHVDDVEEVVSVSTIGARAIPDFAENQPVQSSPAREPLFSSESDEEGS